MIQQYLSKPAIRTAVMILLGIGLAAIFRTTCEDERCVVIRAPDPANVENQVFKYADGCYRFQAKIVPCQ